MPAYVIADVQVTDPIGFETYKNAVPPVVEACGGIFIARGGAIDVLDGNWKPSRLTLLKFDSVAQAKAWYDSPDYRPLKDIRSRTTRTNILVVEGV